MASADFTVSLDDESKELIRELIAAVKALNEPIEMSDVSFGDLPGGSYGRRLAEQPQFIPGYSPYGPYRVTSGTDAAEPVSNEYPGVQSMLQRGEATAALHDAHRRIPSRPFDNPVGHGGNRDGKLINGERVFSKEEVQKQGAEFLRRIQATPYPLDDDRLLPTDHHEGEDD